MHFRIFTNYVDFVFPVHLLAWANIENSCFIKLMHVKPWTEIADSTLHRTLIFYVNLTIWIFIIYFQDLVGNVESEGRQW